MGADTLNSNEQNKETALLLPQPSSYPLPKGTAPSRGRSSYPEMETLEVSLSRFHVQVYPIKITQHLPLRFWINILVRLAGPDANVD